MSTDEQAIEQEIQEKELTAPRLTPDHIDSTMASADYHVFNGTVTVCCITLKNGFSILGHSAPVSAENFDEALGRKIAFNNARDKIWELEGYLLRQRLADNETHCS